MSIPHEPSTDRAKQLGFIVLQSDETLEQDMRRLLPDDIEYLVSRVASDPTVTNDSLEAMRGDLARAASLFPQGLQFSGVAYGCTSGTAQIGAEDIAELIRTGLASQIVTEPLSALIAACRHLELTRIGMVSPYIESVSDRLRTALAEAGIQVTHFASFDEPVEANVVRISKSSIASAAIDMGRHADCDAVFLSCTNLRTLDVIDQVEAEIAKPVLSSNQVLAWHLCSLCQLSAPPRPVGRLLRKLSGT